MLIGAGCVATLETAAVTLEEYGPAPRFTAAIKAGTLKIIDGTCPAIHSGLTAAEKGSPLCRCAASSVPIWRRIAMTG